MQRHDMAAIPKTFALRFSGRIPIQITYHSQNIFKQQLLISKKKKLQLRYEQRTSLVFKWWKNAWLTNGL